MFRSKRQFHDIVNRIDIIRGYTHFLHFLPMSQIVRIHASSGTTGKPTVVGYTRKDLSSWAECISRAFTAYGAGRSDIFQVSLYYHWTSESQTLQYSQLRHVLLTHR